MPTPNFHHPSHSCVATFIPFPLLQVTTTTTTFLFISGTTTFLFISGTTTFLPLVHCVAPTTSLPLLLDATTITSPHPSSHSHLPTILATTIISHAPQQPPPHPQKNYFVPTTPLPTQPLLNN